MTQAAILVPEHSDEKGAHKLAHRIMEYWMEHGFAPPDMIVEPAMTNKGTRQSVCQVRSDMVNGVPRERTIIPLPREIPFGEDDTPTGAVCDG